jgi:cyclic pyranopterin phosphate synthase
MRFFSSRGRVDKQYGRGQETPEPELTHLNKSGAVHMVSISEKAVSSRKATAACSIWFSDPTALRLVRENQMKKGDVLGVARVAGIMAAKRTADMIPLCHPIALSHVSLKLEPGEQRIDITAVVECDGKTGVEMEALMAASTAAMTVYDMCKAVDKGMVIERLRVTRKEGGRSGIWEAPDSG